ncbi:MAG: prolyl-tRNA synthetase, partial [Bacteriovoracaceae bacterium]|nr:prolyl-tRNA synthetase [Bacteriovoracaceae bacterium]
IDVIWDDRAISPGVKLKDADLVGIPFQLIVGDRGLKNNQVDWKIRSGMKKDVIALPDAVNFVLNFVREEKRKPSGAA